MYACMHSHMYVCTCGFINGSLLHTNTKTNHSSHYYTPCNEHRHIHVHDTRTPTHARTYTPFFFHIIIHHAMSTDTFTRMAHKRPRTHTFFFHFQECATTTRACPFIHAPHPLSLSHTHKLTNTSAFTL